LLEQHKSRDNKGLVTGDRIVEPLVIERPQEYVDEKAVCTCKDVIVTAESTLEEITHVVQECVCYKPNGRKVGLPGSGAEFIFCSDGYFVGCQDMRSLGPRWYLCCKTTIFKTYQIVFDVSDDDYMAGMYKNIFSSGHITLWGDESLFLMARLRGYRGYVWVMSSWPRDIVEYRARKVSVQLFDPGENDTLHVSVDEGAITYKCLQSYVRYPEFKRYKLDIEYMDTYLKMCEGRVALVNLLYGVPIMKQLQDVKDKYKKQDFLNVEVNLVYWTMLPLETASYMQVEEIRDFYRSVRFLRTGFFSVRLKHRVVNFRSVAQLKRKKKKV